MPKLTKKVRLCSNDHCMVVLYNIEHSTICPGCGIIGSRVKNVRMQLYVGS